jgi:hypothetical protein
MTHELNFASFLGNKGQEQQASSDTQEIEASSVVDNEVTGTEATTEDSSQEQEVPSTAAPVSLAALLEKKGVQIEGGDSEELYENVISRALAGSKAMSEVARLQAELESLRAAAQQTTPTAPQQTAATPVSQATEGNPVSEQTAAKLFRELQKYDPLLENYVERDESGYAKPVAMYGQMSIDAARQINDYERASREQADRILRNPLAIVEDSRDMITKIAEERAKQIVESRISAIMQEQERAAREYAAANEQKSLQQQEFEWHESNKAKLFHLDANGEPKRDFLGGDGPAWTSTGQKFLQKLTELRNTAPGVPDLVLRNLAIEFASAGQSPAQPQQQAQPAAPPAQQPVLTQAQQRNLLANNRQAIPNSNTPTANVHQVMSSPPRLRLAEMAQLDPANAERISGWRR